MKDRYLLFDSRLHFWQLNSNIIERCTVVPYLDFQFMLLFFYWQTVLPTLGGYLNEGGFLNLPRFERFMETLSQYELEKFDDIYSGLHSLPMKRRTLKGLSIQL